MRRNIVILAYPKIDHEKNYVYFWMPFSVLTIAKAIMDETNLHVLLFDGNQQSIEDWNALIEENEDRILFVGISLMTGGGQIGHGLALMDEFRRRSARPIVVGGPHVNVLPEQTIAHPLIDYALTGPGQASAPKFSKFMQGEVGFSDVPGIVTWKNGGAHFGLPNTPRSRDIGKYPWSLIDVRKYIRNDPTVASRTLNYVSSQGCVYKCRFCYELSSYNRKWSSQPAQSLLNDIEKMVREFGVNGIKFYDADWFINIRRSKDFCDGLISRDLGIKWAASINPNDVVKARRLEPDLMEAVAASGCNRLLMGIESGSDRVLDEVVKKEISKNDVLNVAKEIAEIGIMGSYTFIVGFPGETESEMAETYDFLNTLRELDPQPETRVHLFAPYPGTPLYLEAVKYGFIPPADLKSWSNFDYYESQTPWTSADTAKIARANTHMVLSPEEA